MTSKIRAPRRVYPLILAMTMALAIPLGVQTAAPPVAEARTLVWSDEFSGPKGAAPSSKNWRAEVGGRGWGNEELQCYTNSRSNSALNGQGQLVITARRQVGHTCADGARNNWTSARLTTRGLREQKYGYIEIRARIPGGKGVFPAFWALGADGKKWPHAGEFDMMEYIGRSPKFLHYNLHGVDQAGRHKVIRFNHAPAKPPAGRWHTYGVRWTSTSFTYYLDGKKVGSLTGVDAKKAGLRWAFQKPYYFVLNLAMGGTWPGPVDKSITSRAMAVDYVRVYR